MSAVAKYWEDSRLPFVSTPLRKVLIFSIFSLILMGLVVVFSASYPIAVERHGDGFYFFRHQLAFLALGLLCLWVFSKVPYMVWQKWCWPLLFASAVFLILLFIPGIGHKAGGARRWILLGPVRFQPAEFAKLAMVIFLASFLARKQGKMQHFTKSLLPLLLVFGLVGGLVLLQPDFGSFLTLCVILAVMLFLGGARMLHLVYLGIAAMPVVYYLIFSVEYRRERFFAFLNPWAAVRQEGFQIIQSHVAFNLGGIFGRGLGEGKQKLLYLPDIHTDFIFSVIGEELGFVGVCVLMSLYLLILIMGFGIAFKAIKAKSNFAFFLSSGLTLFLVLPALINMGVVLGMLPTKGLVLPFISYGGSALVICLSAAGILLNLSRFQWMRD